MLDNIKSEYFIKNIFSIVNIKLKFKLAKYNKILQNKLELDLIDYRMMGSRYIEYNSNGIGKEYNSENKLIYEGEYLNGQRNGKGKEYYHNKGLKFEGEYLKGKRWKGKGYNPYDRSIAYELNDGKGFIKDYEYSGVLIYEGEILNGERNGQGKEYEFIGIIFEGEFKNGKKWNGKGYDKQNNKIVCEIKDGKGCIKDYGSFGGIISEYEYLNGEKNGKGKKYDLKGNITFEGNYINNEINGEGKEYYPDGKLLFEGYYLNGKKNGKVKKIL